MNPEPTAPADEELIALCEAAIEDRLTDEQRHRLEERVLADPAARRFYVEYVRLHAVLHWSAGEGEAPAEPTSRARREPRPPRAAHSRRWRWAAGLVAAGVLIGLAWFAWPGRSGAVAVLADGKGCKWEAGTLPTEAGARLGQGRLRLAEGLARLTFTSGAEVALEAPADLELVSAERCVLHAGRLVARVPAQASGFTVDTPTARLKDLGTEFGVSVRDNHSADVQVFQGEVDVQHRPTGRMERVRTGQSFRFGAETVREMDPQVEKPARSLPDPVGRPDGRLVQLSTAMGRGKDAYVQPLYPSEHHSDVLLLVKSTRPEGSNYNRKAYIGIDLSAVAGRAILDAQLSLTFAPTSMGFASEVPDATFAVYGLTDEALDGWDERTIRWNNAPANGPGGTGLDPAKTTLLGTFTIRQGELNGTRSIGGPQLVRFLQRDTNGLATFIVVRQTPGSGRNDLVHGFASKNHPSLPSPTLKVTVER
jgi:ferric-dicitrate binding protein FerR (iron transport regulator)